MNPQLAPGRPGPTSLSADPWQTHAGSIVAIRDETPGVRSYDLKIVDTALRASYRFAPGQFNMLYLPGIGEAAISISSDPATPDRLTHTVRAVGNVTAALARLVVGDQIFLRGPYGQPWPLGELEGADVIFVAGGLGPERVWVSLERNMSCAVGQCGLCQFGPYFVCLDGPVFRHDRIERLLAVRCL